MSPENPPLEPSSVAPIAEHVEAVGQTLSGRNAGRIKGAITALAEVLTDAGWTPSDLSSLVGAEPEDMNPVISMRSQSLDLVRRIERAKPEDVPRLKTQIEDLLATVALRSRGEVPVVDMAAARSQLAAIDPGAVAAIADDRDRDTCSVRIQGTTLTVQACDNDSEFSGVLFECDRPSTYAPEGSGGRKLLIVKSVAESALRRMFWDGGPLPLNAADDLSRHDLSNIVGVFSDGWIDDTGRAIVHGFLFDYNRPELVARISEQAPLLGMSLEAKVLGGITTIAGEEVFVAAEVILTGATIAYREAVAYGGTAVLSAIAEPEVPDLEMEPIAIAAAALDPPSEPEVPGGAIEPPPNENHTGPQKEPIEIMSTEATPISTEALTKLMATIEGQTEQVNDLTEMVHTLTATVETLTTERDHALAEAAAARQANEEAEKQREMEARINAAVEKALADRQIAPQRRTATPQEIAATAPAGLAIADSPIAAIDAQIAVVQGQIDGLATAPGYIGMQDLQLKEQLGTLKARRAVLQSQAIA